MMGLDPSWFAGHEPPVESGSGIESHGGLVNEGNSTL